MNKTLCSIIVMSAIIQAQSLAQIVQPGQSVSLEAARTEMPRRVVSVKNFLATAKNQKEMIEKLETLYGSTIENNTENVDELTSRLASSNIVEEKVVLVRAYASLYAHDMVSETNTKIEATLRNLAQSNEKGVATAALLRYSRLRFFKDTEELLDLQHRKGFINEDDLYGELSHIFNFAPESDQVILLDRIAASHNSYALDIVAANMKDEMTLRKLPAPTRRVLQNLLEENQPKFSVAIGEFSLKEAIVYSDWLHTLASVTSQNSRVGYDSVVLDHLDNITSNPKKAISYFSSDEGKLAAARIGRDGLKRIFKRISSYATSLPFPQQATLRDFATNVLNLQNQIRP